MAKSTSGTNIPFVFKTTSGSGAGVDIYAQEDTVGHTHQISSQSYSTGARTLNGSLVYGVYEAPVTISPMDIKINGVVRMSCQNQRNCIEYHRMGDNEGLVFFGNKCFSTL